MTISKLQQAAELAISSGKQTQVIITCSPEHDNTEVKQSNKVPQPMPASNFQQPFYSSMNNWGYKQTEVIPKKVYLPHKCNLKVFEEIARKNGYMGVQDMMYIYAEILERIALTAFDKDNDISGLIKSVERQYNISMEAGSVLWTNKQTGACGTRVIDFLCDYFEIAFTSAVATLATYLNLGLSYIFNLGSLIHPKYISLPMAFQYEKWKFNVLATYHFSDEDGIAICEINGNRVPLQIGFINSLPVIGGQRKIHWLHQKDLARNQTATIIIFLDIVVAIDISEHFQQVSGNVGEYIFTGCPHMDFDKLDFSFFTFAKVVLVYSSDMISRELIENISEKLKAVSATIKYCDCEISDGKYSMKNLENRIQQSKRRVPHE